MVFMASFLLLLYYLRIVEYSLIKKTEKTFIKGIFDDIHVQYQFNIQTDSSSFMEAEPCLLAVVSPEKHT